MLMMTNVHAYSMALVAWSLKLSLWHGSGLSQVFQINCGMEKITCVWETCHLVFQQTPASATESSLLMLCASV